MIFNSSFNKFAIVGVLFKPDNILDLRIWPLTAPWSKTLSIIRVLFNPDNILDLYGLLLLLGVKPYQFRFWWNRLLWEPYVNFNIEPVTELFSQLLWRNSKKDVAKEVQILVA